MYRLKRGELLVLWGEKRAEVGSLTFRISKDSPGGEAGGKREKGQRMRKQGNAAGEGKTQAKKPSAINQGEREEQVSFF